MSSEGIGSGINSRFRKLVKLPFLLFLTTIATTLWAGYQMSMALANAGFANNPAEGAVAFSIGILLILGAHEMGHYLMARRRGIETTVPYFIPAPFFLGTLGAVIRMKTLPADRNALFDLGAAGPILGFLILVPLTILGISWSYSLPPEAMPKDAMILPDPLLFRCFSHLLNISHGELLLHPLAFAGWVGMVVTMLNLIPVGSLDGGHIAWALFGGKYHRWISFFGVLITILLGYWLMAVLMLFLALRRYPGPVNDFAPLSPGRRLFSWILLALLILCAAPTSLSINIFNQ